MRPSPGGRASLPAAAADASPRAGRAETGGESRLLRCRPCGAARRGRRVLVALAFAAGVVLFGLLLESASPDGRGGAGGLQPADAAGFFAVMKRAANQGWRIGARALCAIFGLQYKTVKNAFRRAGRSAEFEALAEEMDHYLQAKEEAGNDEDSLPDVFRERGLQLVIEAQALFSQVLGKHIELPVRYKRAMLKLREKKRRKKDVHGGAASKDALGEGSVGRTVSPAAQGSRDEGHQARGVHTKSTDSVRVSGADSEPVQGPAAAGGVNVPVRDQAFEAAVNERLRALKAKHEADVGAIVDEANTLLRQYQEEHKMTYDNRINALRAQQQAELEQIHRDLHDETMRFEEGKKHYEVVSAHLTEAKAGMAVLGETMQVIAANFFSIEQLLEKLTDERQALERVAGGKSEIQRAFQAIQQTSVTQEQSAQAVVTIRQRATDVTAVLAQLEEVLARADTTLSTAPSGALFESQQQGYSEYLRSYQMSLKESKERLAKFEQEVDAKLLALNFAGEELQAKAIARLGVVTETLAREYAAVQSKAQELEQSYQEFFQSCQHIEEHAVNTAKMASQDRVVFAQMYAELSGEFSTLQVTLQKLEESMKQLSTDVTEVEKVAVVFGEGLNSIPLTREVLTQLNSGLVGEMTRFFSSYKHQVLQASSALRQRFQASQDFMRKLDLLAKETRTLADPAALERLEAEILSLLAELEAKQRDVAEADGRLKEARAVVLTLQRQIRQLEQRLSTERRMPGRWGGVGGAGGSTIGSSMFGGLGASSSAIGSIVEEESVGPSDVVREIEVQLALERGRLQDAERDKQDQQRRFAVLESEVRELHKDVEAKRRIVTEEQQKMARLEQLAAAVAGGPGSGIASTLGGGLRGSLGMGTRAVMTAASGLLGGSLAGGVGLGSRPTSLGGIFGSRAGFTGASAVGGIGSLAGGLAGGRPQGAGFGSAGAEGFNRPLTGGQ
ncbi:hypothetical protein BESB_020490 [Besnoitia besnoiti]|uniref:Transmembrane protein n=1 Tax=Besnoitia besnoiti TaxID=94643 RepID=A0A2A9M0I7_BESBE|nr:hypothetical protein BESB_020490 [Besnoitia besnoiti]PFH32108.1 hypothetical protein BESB_020490 [Besnoitia besnoiti]